MSSIKKKFLEILNEITNAFDKGDRRKIDRIHESVFGADGNLHGTCVEDTMTSKDLLSSKTIEREIDPEEIFKKYSKYSSREELESYLREVYPLKTEISQIARALSLHTLKTDTYDSLVNKVIDATLGYHLRSKTIRGDGRSSN